MGPLSSLPQSSASAKLVAQCDGEVIGDLDRNLWDLLASTAAAYPHHEAVVSLWQSSSDIPDRGWPIADGNAPNDNTPLRWTYQALLNQSEALAAGLRSRGCKTGDRLVVFFWNSAEWAIFFWASIRLGLVFVPLHPRLSAPDVRHLLGAIEPAVIVVPDTETESMIQDAAQPSVLEKTRLRLSCSSEPSGLWTPLNDVNKSPRERPVFSSTSSSLPRPTDDTTGHIDSSARGDAPALIITTSGTTSTPKCCVHTAVNLISQSHRFDPNPAGTFERWLVHTPVSHIFAINHALRAWRNGDTVVFPSKSFEVKATVRALVEEKCTRMSAIPALLKGLLNYEGFPGKESLSLKYVAMGSTMIHEADIQLARSSLGSKDAIQAFGMSEGAPITSWIRGDPLLVDGYRPGVGKVLPGCRIRICAPETHISLNRNEVGELHIGGTSVIKGYLQGADADKFYEDDAGHWCMTGDQAMIDNDGVLHLSGRYKDIIIRAGENIAPVKLESALEALPGVTAQVVGLPDHIAGQVPVAIVSKPESVSKEELDTKALELGPIYRLDGIYTLEEIGCKAFPRTATGKVRKQELKEVVLQFRAKLAASKTKQPKEPQHIFKTSSQPINGRKYSGLIQTLCSIWEELAGIRPDPDSDISDVMDSIMALRYCHKVLMELGCRLYLQDLAASPTIAGQASIISARGFTRNSNIPEDTDGPSVTPFASQSLLNSSSNTKLNVHMKVDDLSTSDASFTSDMSQKSAFRRAVSQVLQHMHLTIDDVEDLYPIKDSYHRFVLGARPQSYRHRFSFEIRAHSKPRVRQVLEAALSSSGILRALLAITADATPFHVIAKPSRVLFERMIKEVSAPDNEACQLVLDDNRPEAFDPVLTTQATIVNVLDTGKAVLSITHNHSVFDVFSLNLFHSNLDRLLTADNADVLGAASLTPFKIFADLLYLYQDSVPAKISVEANVRRIRGISRFQDAFWPPQRERLNSSEDVQTGSSQMGRIVSLPDMNRLRTDKGIKPVILAKAALAVFNVLQTGEKYAIFSSANAGRTWPFVPAWMERMLPPVMGVDGPTMEWELDMCHVDLTGSRSARRVPETVSELLVRMGDEQESLSKHVHAPWFKVLDGLGSDEAQAAVEASRHQTFVWDVTLQSLGNMLSLGKPPGSYQSMRQIARKDWADSGFYWRCCMLDRERLIFETAWDSAQLTDMEVEGFCNEYSDVLRKLANFDNWDKSLENVFCERRS